MSNATIVPHSQPTLFRTNYDAFAAALRSVTPDLLKQATEYHARAQELGIPFTEDECLGRAVKVLLAMVERDADDELEPDIDPIYQHDYNDDELLHAGIDR